MNGYHNQILELEIYFNYLREKLYRKSPLKFFLILILAIFYISVPGFHIPSLELTKTRITGVMEQRAIENFFIYYPQQSWLNYKSIPDNFKRAAVGVEDDGFFYHKGIDWKSLELASRINLRRGKIVRGGGNHNANSKKYIFHNSKKLF